ncbi:MAG: hypothetical protein AAGA40_03040 [Cyanobacteria bacterium P01_E01_bin.45]
MPSSSADAIAQSLNEQFQADDIFFQIVEHSQVLHVYLNHQPGAQIDYTRITAGIQQAVVDRFSGPADGFWLYSRELGNTQPNWQTYIQTPRHTFTRSAPERKSSMAEPDFGQTTDALPNDMVQLTGTTDEMQRAIGYAGISRDQADAATEIAGSGTTIPNIVKAPQVIDHSHPNDDDVATEMVSLPSAGLPEEIPDDASDTGVEGLEEHADTEMVPLGGDLQQVYMSDGQRDVDEDAATEMVSLGGQGSGQSLSSVQQVDRALDEHSETEMVPLGQGGAAMSASPASSLSGASAGESWDEESATEMVSLGHTAAGIASARGAAGESWDEESATEMVSLGHAGTGMPSSATHQFGEVVDEESATEMVSLSGLPEGRIPGGVPQFAADVDEESATEMVQLGGAKGSVLSSFAARKVDGTVDEDSATEIVPAGTAPTMGIAEQSAVASHPASGPIAAEDIKFALNSHFRADGLQFQVAMRDGKWHICANRAADARFDFEGVGDRVRRELQQLPNATVESFWFYSRAAGQRETERKALLSLSAEQMPRATSAVVGNGGVVGEPEEKQAGSSVELSQYCFVRNRLLLQGKLLPPSDQVTRLLKTFHQLSDAEKTGAIDSVDRIFKGQKPQSASGWLQDLEGLSDSDLRKAAIWFSRYCEQPADTIQQIDTVLNAPKAAPPTPKPAAQPDTSAMPVSGGPAYQSPYSPEAYQQVAAENDSSSSRKINYPKWLRFVLPLAWVVYMAIVVVTGSSNELYSLELPECQSSASPQACELAALVATPDGVRSMATSTPYTPTYEEEASLVEACEQNASFFSDSISTPITSTLSSVSETLPGVYLVDIQYPGSDSSSGSMVRTACVASLEGWGSAWDDEVSDIPDEWAAEMSGPQVLVLDEIPVAWPATPYDGNPFVDVVNQVGILLNPFFWAGINVFLAAVGLLLTTSLSIGVAATSLETVLIVAIIYGALDSALVSAFHFIPLFSLLTSPLRRFAILSGAGSIFKDFMLDRGNLFKLVLGLTLLFFIQFIGKFALGFFMGFSAAISAFS